MCRKMTSFDTMFKNNHDTVKIMTSQWQIRAHGFRYKVVTGRNRNWQKTL